LTILEYMFEAPVVDDLDAGACARALESSVEDQRRLGARRFALVAHWADVHAPLPETPSPRSRPVQIGADGTPDVTEFTAMALGLTLGISTITATCLLRDVLNVRHRLPQLWDAVLTGEIDDWKAREVARLTAPLTAHQARWVDAEILEALVGLPWGRALSVVEGKVVAADPEGHDERRRAEEQRRYVAVGRRDNPYGLRTLVARTTAGEIARLLALVDHLASLMATAGDTEPADVRRAKALGLLGDPARACLFLADAHEAAPDPTDVEDRSPTISAALEVGRMLRSLGAAALERLRPRTVLYVHLAQEAVEGVPGTQVARTEGFGALSLEQLRTWLGTDKVVVRPVIDVANQRSVDRYEVPRWLDEAITLREPFEVFPWGTTASRHSDKDHTEPFDHHAGAPPGQTAMDNLGPLARSHHRAKSFGGFALHQPLPGLYLWRAPTGCWYRVDHTGTTRLGYQTPDIIEHQRTSPSRLEASFRDVVLGLAA
jgi:hypothetical protein